MNEKDIRIGNSLLLYGEVVKVTEIGFRIDDYYLRVEHERKREAVHIILDLPYKVKRYERKS